MEAFLIRRGFDVDVGVIEQNVRDESGKNVRKQLEIDFVVNRGDERCYIQSALEYSVFGIRKINIQMFFRNRNRMSNQFVDDVIYD